MLFVAKLKLGRQKGILSEKFSRTSSASRISKHTVAFAILATYQLVVSVQRQTAVLFEVTSVVRWVAVVVR
jgi:hypothetical protein